MPKILIVGHGFVGQAVDYAFSNVDKYIVDPKYETNTNIPVDSLPQYDCVFVCVPTPMGSSGNIDTRILDDVLQRLEGHPLVVVKSTVTPDVIKKYDVVYNPEFLTEAASKEQFVSASFHILGGDPQKTKQLEEIYSLHSLCNHADFYHMTVEEASFVKYTINCFLAMKVTFFNQLFDVISETDANFMTVIKAIAADNRIGSSHTKVPGYDGKQGFGGACFPKDVSAFINYSNKLTLLQKCATINNDYRSQYELDSREIEQHVYYGKTQEEQ